MSRLHTAVALAHRYTEQGRSGIATRRMLRAAGLSVKQAVDVWGATITGQPMAIGEDEIIVLPRTWRIDRASNPLWQNIATSSACAGRDEYGAPSKQVDNSLQSVIGLPRCGGEGETPPDISTRASGQLFVGTYQGVPVYADPVMPV